MPRMAERRIRMRSLERLIGEQKRKEQQKKAPQLQEPDEVEIMMERPLSESLDTASGIYDKDMEKRFGGINTAPSVFDKKTLFRVPPEEK